MSKIEITILVVFLMTVALGLGSFLGEQKAKANCEPTRIIFKESIPWAREGTDLLLRMPVNKQIEQVTILYREIEEDD